MHDFHKMDRGISLTIEKEAKMGTAFYGRAIFTALVAVVMGVYGGLPALAAPQASLTLKAAMLRFATKPKRRGA